jgi:hypothetical protein
LPEAPCGDGPRQNLNPSLFASAVRRVILVQGRKNSAQRNKEKGEEKRQGKRRREGTIRTKAGTDLFKNAKYYTSIALQSYTLPTGNNLVTVGWY